MELYAAIDLHSNNSMLVVLDQDDHVILERRPSRRGHIL